MKSWILVFSCLMSFFTLDLKGETIADLQIEIDPFDDDDEYYDEGPQIWIGPGLYYGIWFENEFEYGNWCQRGYYRDYYHHDHDHHDHHGEHHEGHHGGGHGGGGHR